MSKRANTDAGQLRVEYRALADLLPYARNARTHTEQQIAEIAGSIQQFGFVNPVLLAEDGTIIAGHGRVAAARVLKMAQVPTISLVGLSESQRRALVLADNRIAQNAGWDAAMLALELRDLRDMGASLEGLGFSEAELAAALAPPTAGLTDPDEAPPVPVEPVSRPGDLWVLGRHRLLCGDSTVVTDVDRLLGGVKPGLMVTDPPYGVDYDPKWRLDAGLNAPWQTRAEGRVENDTRSDWREAWALFPGDVVYCWHGGLHAASVAESLNAAGFEVRSQIIWAKPALVISRGHYHWQHEPCWYAVRKGGTGHWGGDRKQSTLWTIQNMHRTQGSVDDGKTAHGTQKPVECMRRPIVNNSSPGQAVYEPFSGSGTTIIAAEMEGRSCYAIEMNPAYVDVAVKRWQQFTGQAAVLESTGQPFAEPAK